MFKKLKSLILFSIIVAIVICLGSLGYILKDEIKYRVPDSKSELVKIIGNYSVNGKYQGILPENFEFDLMNNNTIDINGNFNIDIPENKLITMRITNLRVKIFLNDKKIYSFGEIDTLPPYINSGGNTWDSFISPGIKSTDNIRIELYNVYTNPVNSTFETFLNNIYCGYDSTLMIENIRSKLLNSIIALFIIFIGILSLIFAFFMVYIKRHSAIIFCFSFLSFFSGIWFFINFKIQNYIIPYPIFNNSLDIVSLALTASFLMFYFALGLKSKWKNILSINGCICLITCSLISITQLLGLMDYYDFVPLIYFLTVVSVILMVSASLCELKKFKDKLSRRFACSAILLAIGMITDIICNLLDIHPYIFWFKISFFIFIVLQFNYLIEFFKILLCENAKIQVLQEMAYTDCLTELNNRTSYFEKVQELDAAININVTTFAVIIFDINGLKQINDNLGHALGDFLIVETSKLLSDIFKKNSIYRIGGDEFVIILENINEPSLETLMCHFRASIKELSLKHSKKVQLSIASGFAIFTPKRHTSYNDVFKEADTNMYTNKSKMNKSNIIL